MSFKLKLILWIATQYAVVVQSSSSTAVLVTRLAHASSTIASDQTKNLFNAMPYTYLSAYWSIFNFTEFYHMPYFQWLWYRTIGCTLNRVHNSHLPVDRFLCIFWPFDLILIGSVGEVSWWTIPVPSLVILFSAVLVLSCGQTDRQNQGLNHRCCWTPFSHDYRRHVISLVTVLSKSLLVVSVFMIWSKWQCYIDSCSCSWGLLLFQSHAVT